MQSKVSEIIPRGLSIADAARYLGTTSSFIRSQIKEGNLPAVMLGKRYIVDRLDLDHFLEKQKDSSGNPDS